MSRYFIIVLMAAIFCLPASLRAQGPAAFDELNAAPTAHATPWMDDLPETPRSHAGPWTEDYPMLPAPTNSPTLPKSLQDYTAAPGIGFEPDMPHNDYLPALGWFGLRHSRTHGRHSGRGTPLSGTSWLNRPYYVGVELGSIWLTQPIHEDVTTDTDAFGGIFLGWDRDPYWGAELRFDWATPELINRNAPTADRTDSLFMWNYSFIYYPWGDAKWRPYWRAGIGDTQYDFPLDDGSRHDQWMLTFPIGIGVKYPIERWLAARAEVTDHIGVGHHQLDTQNNVTLTFGLEWHFGAHPRSYWPWNPDRHIW